MNLDELKKKLINEPDDVIELLEQITDENIQELKDHHCVQELQNLKEIADDILIMLQTTASGGHLIDVSRIQMILRLVTE